MSRLLGGIQVELQKRKSISISFVLTIMITLSAMWIMMSLQPYFLAHTIFLDSYADIAKGTAEGKIWSFLQWYIGEWSEPQVFRILPAALLSVVTAFAGYYFERVNSKWRGSDTCGGTGLFPQIFAMSILSLLICDLIYYRDAAYGFMPTFIPMACVIVALTLEYGCDWKKFVTITSFAGTIPYLIARYAVLYLMDPFQFPRPVGGWIGMLFGTMIAWQIVKILPWMTKRSEEQKQVAVQRAAISDKKLYIERILADPSELICWGSSWNTIGMLIGGILGWAMNPNASSCKEGWIPVIFAAQFLTLAISNYIFFPWIKEKKMPYVFTGYVPISCFINCYVESSMWIFISILASAILAPLLTKWIEVKWTFLKKWPIAVTCISSMILFTLGWSIVLQLLGF